MKKKILVWTCIVILVTSFSCTTDEPALSLDGNSKIVSLKRRELLKESFGRALSKSLTQSQSFRSLIKTEALEMFNNDFDVLYQMIKDRTLEEGITVHNLLSRNMDKAGDLNLIEKEIPLLTIFVPELPENSFSAATWHPASQIPVVGIESKLSNEVKMIQSDLTEFSLTSNQIPAFPVVVVKENERVTVASNELRNQKRSRSFNSATGSGYQFEFLSDCFDKTQNDSRSARITSSLDQVIKDAYTIYEAADGWQRDYIYYGITPSVPNGPFSYDFQEHITTFSMNGTTPSSGYSKIADQSGDPKKKEYVQNGGNTPSQNSGWTGGFYEFKVRLLFNSRNGLGEELVTYFSALPSELFELEYEKNGPFFGGFYLWEPKIKSFKTKSINLPLFNWDLNDYASTIKIEIEEIDLTVTTQITESRSVKFATNFAIEGVLKKIGLKFGASLEQTQTQNTVRTFTEGNDLLGSVIINFADKVVVDDHEPPFGLGSTLYETRVYTTGWFKIGVEPKRVQ